MLCGATNLKCIRWYLNEYDGELLSIGTRFDSIVQYTPLYHEIIIFSLFISLDPYKLISGATLFFPDNRK